MKVRFRGDNLELEDGTFADIPKERLLEACLQNDYRTVSIIEIVKETMKNIFDYEVWDHMYRKSELFNYLERGIVNDVRYQMRKEEVMHEAKICRENALKAREGSIERYKDPLYRYLKRRKAMMYYTDCKGGK